MTDGLWVLGLVVAAALLPALLLAIVRFGERRIAPPVAALARVLARLQEDRPLAWMALMVSLELPAIAYVVATRAWPILIVVALQLIAVAAQLLPSRRVPEGGIEES